MTVNSSFYDYPVWTTPPYLGTFAQDYSFDLNPIQIVFGANTNSVVSILNGSLPLGLTWRYINNQIIISGSVVEDINTISSKFTFRITQTNGAVADRTFFLNLTAIIRVPNWSNQQDFLGYQSNISINQYTLNATSTSGNHILYDLPSNPSYANINTQTGTFTLNAKSFSSNLTISTTVRATDSVTLAASNVNVNVSISTSPGPLWVTPAGPLGNFYSTEFVEINLVAEDPFSSTPPNYSILSNGTPLYLSSTGLLYGTLPSVATNTNYNINVIASSSNISNSRVFSLTNVPSTNNQIFYWVSDSNLGSINEGEYQTINIKAVTTRGTTIIYNVTGGLLPPHMILGSTDGNIVGFVEYIAITKTYYFDVTATDGYETIVKQFSLQVNKTFANQFISAYIPLTGSLRDNWITDAYNVKVREPGTIVFDSITNISNYPQLEIINGIQTGYATPIEILSTISPWFSQLSLQIGPASNTTVLSNGYSVIFRNIVDSQSGANLQISSSHVNGGIIYPISIQNIRTALLNNYPSVQSGSGRGLILFPNLDWNTGAILSVSVLDSGLGYLSPPKLVVTGSGSGAQLQSVLGLVQVTIVSSGTGWLLGQIVTVFGFDVVDQALLMVNAISPDGKILSLKIVSSGNYRQVGSQNTTTIQTNISYAVISLSFGVVSVLIEDGGQNYQCGININTTGGELLPIYENTYFPIIPVGEIPVVTAQLACDILNTEQAGLYGTPWQPNYLVLQWQGLTYVGSCIFDEDTTTFDGDTTRFIDTESVYDTVFDEQREVFDNDSTIFDYQDPLMYDLEQVWGGTLIDSGTTVMDLYSTIFDSLRPKTYSNTRLQRWFNTTNKIYSGNNAVT